MEMIYEIVAAVAAIGYILYQRMSHSGEVEILNTDKKILEDKISFYVQKYNEVAKAFAAYKFSQEAINATKATTAKTTSTSSKRKPKS